MKTLKKAEIIRGQGDAKATGVYAQAYSKDRDFYVYYKSLSLYKNLFDKKSSLILSSNNKFLKYFDYDNENNDITLNSKI